MKPGVAAWRCEGCGAIYFPQRLLCAHCPSSTFREERIEEAVIEEITTIRHVLGQKDWAPRRLANVRTPEGLHLTIGVLDQSRPGDRVALVQDGLAPFGQAAGNLSAKPS
jgi:uncharacterized OB-fold protein